MINYGFIIFIYENNNVPFYFSDRHITTLILYIMHMYNDYIFPFSIHFRS